MPPADSLSAPELSEFPRNLGDFRLRAEIGRGGSGVVYQATWGHREIALKVLHPDLAVTEKMREQFLVEAKRLSELSHPGVVKVLAVGALTDGRPYLAMERLPGRTLSERLTDGPLPLPMAMALAQQLCAAIAAMHERGLIHRDLKPENVFLVGERHAVLLDFGIAKDVFAAPSTTTQDGGIRGTPAYMAPERFFGQSASVSTDVYEIAVVVYAMIAARLPWESLTDPAARLAPTPLVEAPNELDLVLRQAMSTRADNRPPSVTEFASALRAAWQSSGLPDDAPHETQPMPAQSTAPRVDAMAATQAIDSGPVARAADGSRLQSSPWFNRTTTGRRGSATKSAAKPAAKQDAMPAQQTSSTRPRRTLLIGAITVMSLATAAALWSVLNRHSTESTTEPRVSLGTGPMLPTSDDPWNSKNPATISTTQNAPVDKVAGSNAGFVHNAQLDVAIADRIANALLHVPSQTSLVAAVSLADWRASPEGVRMVSVALKNPTVQILISNFSPCVHDRFNEVDWLVLAANARGMKEGFVLQMGGRFDDADMVSCLAAETSKADGVSVSTWAGVADGTLLVKNHELILSTLPKHTAAQLWNSSDKLGLTGRMAEMYKRVKPSQSIAVVVDFPNDEKMEGLPSGTDVVATVKLTTSNFKVDMSAETRNETDAKELEQRGVRMLTDSFGSYNKLINLHVTRRGSIVSLVGDLPPAVLNAAVNALAK
jgi:serine/threonine protein kinase